jgi:ubiquinone/menaquinone biosynthesis C-methylase UbiE
LRFDERGARTRTAERKLAAQLQADGAASATPFDDGVFDLTFCQAAFENFTEPAQAISEM